MAEQLWQKEFCSTACMYKCSYETLGVRVASIFVEVWLAFVLALAMSSDLLKTMYHPKKNVRVSIMMDCKKIECCGGGEMRKERENAGCKLAASFNTKTQEILWRDKWAIY